VIVAHSIFLNTLACGTSDATVHKSEVLNPVSRMDKDLSCGDARDFRLLGLKK